VAGRVGAGGAPKPSRRVDALLVVDDNPELVTDS
jgi:hypothetical protein